MGEFIFNRGRSRTAHGYPDTRAGANSPPATLAFARNFAQGPGTEVAQAITTTGTQIEWGDVDVPNVDPEDIPITPKSTGIIRVSGVVVVQNDHDATPHNVTVQVQIDDVTILTPAAMVTIDQAAAADESNGLEAIPFLVEIEGIVVGATINIEVLVTSANASSDGHLSIVVNDSTCEVLEVPVSTG